MGALRVCCYKTHSLNLDATLIIAVGKIRDLYLKIGQNRAEQYRKKESRPAKENFIKQGSLRWMAEGGWEKEQLLGNKMTVMIEARQEKKNKTNITYGSEWQEFQSEVFFVHVQRQHAHTTPPPGHIVVMATTHIGSAACPWVPERAP